jgi:hypothetical protein
MLEGRCLCGAIRYRTAAEPLFQAYCCCDDCQRTSGSGHLRVIGVPREGFELLGEPRRYDSVGGSGRPTVRNFCGVCGSTLFGEPGDMPDVLSLYVGGLVRPKRFVPTGAIFVRDLCSWDVLPEDLNLWQAHVGDFADSEASASGDGG